MIELSAEQFAQTAFDLNLLEERQLRDLWGELGSRNVAADELVQSLLRRELLTNWQVERLQKGERGGYFYGDYKVLYFIGSGTFSRVYRAVHSETGKIVAVKVLRRRLSEDPEQTAQFKAEGQMGLQLRHPNIVPIYEVFSRGMTHYIVMDFIEGQNLREFVKIRKKLDASQSVRLMADVCAGLSYAAERGLTHRDIKLSNVLVSSRGQAKMVDFGLAGADQNRNLSDEAVAELDNPRTIDYAGLERVTGVRKDDPRSDIYFVGCMLYHLLTGKAPLYETKNRVERLSRQRFRDVVPIMKVDPMIPPVVGMIVNKAMELDPDKRYQSPGEMLAELKVAERRLASGDVGQMTADGEVQADLEAEMKQQRAAFVPDAERKTLMFVESDVRMQDLFREQLRNIGYRVLVTIDPERALARLGGDKRDPDCVIFSTRALGASALEAFNRCGDQKKTLGIKAVLLLDEKHADWQAQAKTAPGRVVVMMPVKLKRFQRLLNELVPP